MDSVDFENISQEEFNKLLEQHYLGNYSSLPMTGSQRRVHFGLGVSGLDPILGSNVNFSMLFEILPEINTEMTGERIMILVNARFPKAIHNVASLGRMLKNHFGEDLISDRVTLADTKKQVTVYNLRTRTFEEIIGH